MVFILQPVLSHPRLVAGRTVVSGKGCCFQQCLHALELVFTSML